MGTENLNQAIALTALNDMFKRGSFSICCIDKVAAVLMINPKGRAYDLLSSLHCINFRDMPSEVRKAVPELIKECLGVDVIYQFAVPWR
ncbi:MAG: hypothetical protein ACYDG4_13320 [Desulfuromonadaceae bacterium]